MWIRDKQIRHEPQGHKVADPRQDCFFQVENGGLVDVVHLKVIQRLLDHGTHYEPAYDNLAPCTFDFSGRQIEESPVAKTMASNPDGSETLVKVAPEPAPKEIEKEPESIHPSEEELTAAESSAAAAEAAEEGNEAPPEPKSQKRLKLPGRRRGRKNKK